MVCKLYDNGNCIGRQMFKEGSLSMSAAFQIGEKALEFLEQPINMYCFNNGMDRGLACNFLRWYENKMPKNK